MARKDIFLSHASEDKETFVDKLHKRLIEANYTVWYDKYELRWGDNLITKITEGLNNSEYGIVVISRNYFASHKEWTFMEFEKILTSNKILPILHGITMQEIQQAYPTQHGKLKIWLTIHSEIGLDSIIQKAKKKIDNLVSERDIDYTNLRDLLAAQNWKEADKETYRVMTQAVKTKKLGDWFTRQEILNFPCEDLRTIDQLWVKYSQGRFGFSVQKKISLSISGCLESFDNVAWEKFGARVGWGTWRGRKIQWIPWENVQYNTCVAPDGHLPIRYFAGYEDDLELAMLRLSLHYLYKEDDDWDSSREEGAIWELFRRMEAQLMKENRDRGTFGGVVCFFSRIYTCKVKI